MLRSSLWQHFTCLRFPDIPLKGRVLRVPLSVEGSESSETVTQGLSNQQCSFPL